MATAAGAIAAKARREVAEHFMRLDAVSPEKAVTFAPDSLFQRRAFARWQRAGVIRPVGGERWYLDAPSYAEAVRRRRRIIAVGLVGGLVAAGAALIAH